MNNSSEEQVALNLSEEMINRACDLDLDEYFKEIGDVKLVNSKPTYLTVENIISDSLSSKLIELVNERGKESEWSYNPNCLEYQISNPYSRFPIENDEKTSDVFLELFAIGEFLLRKINANFNNSGFDDVTGHHGFWILKYRENGGFDIHCDTADEGGIQPPVLATASILLNDEFEGGSIGLVDSRGIPFKANQEINSAIVWDGITNHTVTALTKGFRYVLIIHYVGKLK
jgi:hypothetical protein